ncbi:unnamed protein product [Calicophoron daubneyi]|uniref:CUB domain-containing protein n=1 Tax=Calicophoron daubneyi TaxID=300641 RepID=A0AAV2T7B4_CALDB
MPLPYQERCVEYIDLFTTIESPNNNSKNGEPFETSPRFDQLNQGSPRTVADYRLCGGLEGLPQEAFYSVGSVLFLLLHASSTFVQDREGYGGFLGQYSFEPREKYRMDGEFASNSSCHYRFDFLRKDGTRRGYGKFFSPRFPSNYLPNTHCLYEFHAANEDRVVLTFQSISLTRRNLGNTTEKTYHLKCDQEDTIASDQLTVFEVNDNETNYLAEFCGYVQNVQIVSYGPTLSVKLTSKNPNFQGQGFQGEYEFVHNTQVEPSPPLKRPKDISLNNGIKLSERLAADASFEGSLPLAARQDFERKVSHQSIQSPDAIMNRTIFSEERYQRTHGILYSPGFPKRYPPLASLTTLFKGNVGEQVHLSFPTLQLGEASKCTFVDNKSGDRIRIFDGSTVNSPLIASICGSRRSTNAHMALSQGSGPLNVVSTGRSMLVHFTSDSYVGDQEEGYVIHFQFIPIKMSINLEAETGYPYESVIHQMPPRKQAQHTLPKKNFQTTPAPSELCMLGTVMYLLRSVADRSG